MNFTLNFLSMKRVILTLAVLFCVVASASAEKVLGVDVSREKWAVGGRIGSGLQAQAEYKMQSDNYLDFRFGMSWCNATALLTADFQALYQWHIADWDWTPSVGDWFFDAGVGVGAGGREHLAYYGVLGGAKFGIKLNSVPLKIAVDWTPMIGGMTAYGGGYSYSEFHKYGLANLAVSCVYCF